MSTAKPVTAPDRATGVPTVPGRVWRVAIVVVVGAFMTQLDSALVNIGLATLSRDLHTTLVVAQWSVSAYLLALVIGLPLCGWLSRRVGAGRLWMWALLVFTVASLLCAVAPTIGLLIAFRALQGIAGGLLLPAGQTVIAQTAGKALMGRVMSTAGMALVLAPMLGPTIGGLLIAHASWRWLFLVNLPVGVIGLWLGRRFIPPGDPAPATRFDLPGFALVGLALPLLTYAISQAGEDHGLTGVAFLLPLILGIAALVAFGLRGRRTDAPLLRLRLFANAVFGSAAAASFLAGAIQFGALIIWALYFQLARGYDVVGAGLAMAGFALGAAILPLSGRLTDRYGGGPVTLAGAVLTTLSFLAAAALPDRPSLLLVEACLLVLGIGNAMSVVPPSTAAYVSVEQTEVPDAVTIVNIFLRLGGAVGAALLVAVLGNHPGQGTAVVGHFRTAFWWLLGLSVLSVAVALLLIRAVRGRTRMAQ